MTHPKHELARIEMAERLSHFLYDNHQPSFMVEKAGERYWTEFVVGQAKEKRTPSTETRALIVEKLKDLEARKAPRGVSLEEIAGEVRTSSWGANPPDTSSDGTPFTTPNNGSASQPPSRVPSDPLEAPRSSCITPAAESSLRSSERQTGPTNPASEDASKDASEAPVSPRGSGASTGATPSAPVSPRGRGGQASLPAFQKHSETSREAAIGVKGRTDTLRLQVLNLLRERGPLTDEAIAQALRLPQNTARPRRVELMQMGSVIARGKASTASGRNAVTWDIVKFRVECSWCGAVVEEGDRPEPVSHGACSACEAKILERSA